MGIYAKRKDLFKFDESTLLGRAGNEVGDQFLIGEKVDAPSVVNPILGVSSLGTSPLPAREDHKHGIKVVINSTELSLLTGMQEYDTVYRTDNDAEYMYIGGAWRIRNMPVKTPHLAVSYTGAAINSNFSAASTAPTLGSGAYLNYEYAIRDFRLELGCRMFWGTTVGAVGAGSYYWILPYRLLRDWGSFVPYGVAGVYYGGTYYSGQVRQAEYGTGGVLDKLVDVIIDSNSNSIGAATYPGSINWSVMFRINAPLVISELI